MAAQINHNHSGSYINYGNKSEFSIVEVLLNNITNSRDRIIIKLLAQTGCTSNEIINIKYEDINYKAKKLIIRAYNTKNKVQRTIFLSRELVSEITKISDKNNIYVFSSKEGHLSTRSIRKIFDKYSKIVGRKISSRDLRKEYVQQAIKDNKSVEEIGKTIGVKRISKKKYLKHDELGKIRKIIHNSRDKLIFDILFETGCTLKELVNIQVQDIEFRKYRITIQNMKKSRVSTISKKLSLEIKKYAANNMLKNNYLFFSRQSEKISDKRVFQLIKNYSKLSGIINTNSRILRNSTIYNSIRKGKTTDQIKKQTGIKHFGLSHFGILRGKNEN